MYLNYLRIKVKSLNTFYDTFLKTCDVKFVKFVLGFLEFTDPNIFAGQS